MDGPFGGHLPAPYHAALCGVPLCMPAFLSCMPPWHVGTPSWVDSFIYLLCPCHHHLPPCFLPALTAFCLPACHTPPACHKPALIVILPTAYLLRPACVHCLLRTSMPQPSPVPLEEPTFLPSHSAFSAFPVPSGPAYYYLPSPHNLLTLLGGAAMTSCTSLTILDSPPAAFCGLQALYGFSLAAPTPIHLPPLVAFTQRLIWSFLLCPSPCASLLLHIIPMPVFILVGPGSGHAYTWQTYLPVPHCWLGHGAGSMWQQHGSGSGMFWQHAVAFALNVCLSMTPGHYALLCHLYATALYSLYLTPTVAAPSSILYHPYCLSPS